jgi:outer membrane protein assembly factor BamB
MSTSIVDQSTTQKPLRLWPGIVAASLLLLSRFGLPLVIPGGFLYGLIGAAVGTLAIIVWWLFFSRAPWSERLGAIVVMIVALLVTKRLVHESIAGAGMGNFIYVLTIPIMSVALVVWAVVTRRFSTGLRRASMVASILFACGAFTLVRTGGITGEGDSDFHWRWTKTPEQKLLAQVHDEPTLTSFSETSAGSGEPNASPAVGETASPPSESVPTDGAKDAATPATTPSTTELRADWPGFRGSRRDGIVRGVRIVTDWSGSPPVQIWRRPIGPGWSSFAVRGDFCYTQEQRGEEELVACYKVSTGEPVWRHRDAVRFYESNGGAGPRATPTLSNDRLYTFGATGILNALNAANGAVVWSRNVAAETNTKTPGWGFASSPLIIGNEVIVAADATLVAYDLATGHQRWVGPAHRGSYSSPHRTRIDGVDQILLLGGEGAISVAPSDGKVLWEHSWPGGAITQPALIANGDVLINTISMAGGIGTRRLSVSHDANGWNVEERWTSNGLKPYFNDLVLHKGHAYGFDGNILACINLEDGKRKWKGGRYGNGQLVLLPDQDLLLVLSEEGELALVGATPDQFNELARVPAIEGKTWNHPVLVGDVLLVRNGQEMAAFRLALAGR